MSNEEFETYVALMGKLLQLTPAQREQISGELQDHLQMRVADLVGEGVAKPDAIKQAIEEFGDAAVMAKNFQTVINLKRRRWMMRFATLTIAGVFFAAVLSMAMWPEDTRFGSPNKSMAQEGTKVVEQVNHSAPEISAGTMGTLRVERALREVVSLSYDEVPYKTIQKDLEKRTGLNFILSSSARDDCLAEDELCSISLNNLPLRKALQLMLVQYNATFVIDEGVIVIISLDDADDVKWFRIKMFDCRELIKVLPKTGGGGFNGGVTGGGGVFAIRQGFGAGSKTSGAIGPSAAKPTNKMSQNSNSDVLDKKLDSLIMLVEAEAKKNRPVPTAENTLVDLIQNTVQPDSWEDTGQGLGTIEIVNGILVVGQTERVLQEVQNLLTDLEGHIFNPNKRGIKVTERPSGISLPTKPSEPKSKQQTGSD